MTVSYLGDGNYSGLAADTKPTGAVTNAQFFETDTKKRYYWSGSAWVVINPVSYKRFTVERVGSTYWILDQHDKVEGSGSDFQVVIQAILDAMPSLNTYDFEWDAATYALNNPIIIPTTAANNPKHVVFRMSSGPSTSRHGSTLNATLRPTTSFPVNRYAIEANSTAGSNNTPNFDMSGFYFTNIDNFGTKNVNFLKIQSDAAVIDSVHIKDVVSQYAGIPYHLLGGIWWGRFDNLSVSDANASHAPTAYLLLENGGALGSGNPSPKYCYFDRFNATAAGIPTYGIRIVNGNYNYFNFPTIDVAPGPTVAGISLEQNTSDTLIIASNIFFNPHLLDAGNTGTEPYRAGIHLSGQYVMDNWFYCSHMNRVNNHLKIDNGALRNYVQFTGYWAGALVCNSTGAGISNVLEVVAGHATTANAANDAAVTDTGGNLRIIDKRRGAEKGGTAVISDGGTVTHGLFATPLWVWAQSRIAGEFCSITARSSTTFTVAIKKHDNTPGTASQTIDWRAGVYA